MNESSLVQHLQNILSKLSKFCIAYIHIYLYAGSLLHVLVCYHHLMPMINNTGLQLKKNSCIALLEINNSTGNL